MSKTSPGRVVAHIQSPLVRNSLPVVYMFWWCRTHVATISVPLVSGYRWRTRLVEKATGIFVTDGEQDSYATSTNFWIKNKFVVAMVSRP